MANITRRRTGEFMREVFKLLWDKPDGVQAKDVLDHIGRTMKMTEYESGSFAGSPNEERYNKIIRFATIDFVKAGWLIKNKGRWILTELGKDGYRKYSDPDDFYREAIRLYQVWKKGNAKATIPETYDEGVNETSITIEEATENAWIQVLKYLQGKNPYEFQDLVSYLLNAMGYFVVWVAPPGKDQGIDIIAYRDPLGTTIPRIKVQVKHRDNATPIEEMRAFMATLGNDDVGIFVSSGGFTSGAREQARTSENRKITLLDLDKFYE